MYLEDILKIELLENKTQSYDQLTKDYGGMLRKPTIIPRRLRQS